MSIESIIGGILSGAAIRIYAIGAAVWLAAQVASLLTATAQHIAIAL